MQKVVHTTFFNDIINIKNFDPNKTKIDEKSYKYILIYYIGYVTVKNLNLHTLHCTKNHISQVLEHHGKLKKTK